VPAPHHCCCCCSCCCCCCCRNAEAMEERQLVAYVCMVQPQPPAVWRRGAVCRGAWARVTV
jgi:hypothetical protein